MKKIYKTAINNKDVDIDALRTRNETAIAIGNGKMNARGDQLGAGGSILKKREEVVAEYYENNPNAVIQQQVKKPVENKSDVSVVDVPVSKPVTAEVKKKV